LSYFCALLPDQIENYIDPSFAYLARYWHDSMGMFFVVFSFLYVTVLTENQPSLSLSLSIYLSIYLSLL
jgi:hypothetical protein